MIYEHISSILIIVGIDIILGGDNAVVIAMASRNLPERQRNLAIILGTALAIIVRIILTAAVVYLLKVPFLQLVGGMILLFISLKLLIAKEENAAVIKPRATLWRAVQTIVTADIAMGLDNVIAIAGAAHGNTFLVIFGFLISVPIIIFGSKVILHWMERYPILVYIGAAILAYTSGKMMTNEQRIQYIYDQFTFFKSILPILTIIIVIFLGSILNRRAETH
ncbi:YjbE family integral membrane protein [Anoxybacillus vitaminiphilus]|uniref:YjbE family integral membrane protein n=1 Tax=Paranoxybacillus vitaminiphilus TaxID=581036 RepID=A0A327YB61_9BACL|nr:TerC family protein [Anoxybacillus vitaminiphilus]RAK17045.1 YjbE family integral membrane protein [Anoxybacillus vitaminiphilus]